jgi:hypothetical protein
MKTPKVTVVATAIVFLLGARSQAIRFEIVPDEKTVLCDDSEAIVMAEYARRARDSMAKEKPRTAAAELRRVAAMAGRGAESSSGEARDALRAIQNQALKLAYDAETRPDAAARPIRDFTVRTENFLEGERSLLEAKDALTRGDVAATSALLTVAAQQLDRRAQRGGKERGAQFADIAGEIRGLVEETGALGSARAPDRIADLVKTVREIASSQLKPAKKAAISTESEYSTDLSREGNAYEPPPLGRKSAGTGRSSLSESSGYGFGKKADTRRPSASASGSSKKTTKGTKKTSRPPAKTTESYESEQDESGTSRSDGSDRSDESTDEFSRTSSKKNRSSDSLSTESRSDDSATSEPESSDLPDSR